VRLCSSSGPSSTRESVRIAGSRLMTSDRLAPPGLAPHHGLHPHVRARLPPLDHRASSAPGSVAGPTTHCAPRLARPARGPSLARGASHLEVCCLRLPLPFWGPSVRAYSAFALFASARRVPRGPRTNLLTPP